MLFYPAYIQRINQKLKSECLYGNCLNKSSNLDSGSGSAKLKFTGSAPVHVRKFNFMDLGSTNFNFSGSAPVRFEE